MSWGKVFNTINSQLDKAKDFRYFAMLASFLFFLDFTLINLKGYSLSQVSYETIKNHLEIGDVLMFLALYAFFVSFAVPFSKYILWFVSRIIPFKILYFFHHDDLDGVNPNDYFYLHQLKSFAVKNNNSVAYKYYNDLLDDINKDDQLNYFCLAFLIATSLDILAYFENKDALFSVLIPFFDESNNTFGRAAITLILYTLYVFCFYLGVVRGCGFSLHKNDKLYCKNHGFN